MGLLAWILEMLGIDPYSGLLPEGVSGCCRRCFRLLLLFLFFFKMFFWLFCLFGLMDFKNGVVLFSVVIQLSSLVFVIIGFRCCRRVSRVYFTIQKREVKTVLGKKARVT